MLNNKCLHLIYGIRLCQQCQQIPGAHFRARRHRMLTSRPRNLGSAQMNKYILPVTHLANHQAYSFLFFPKKNPYSAEIILRAIQRSSSDSLIALSKHPLSLSASCVRCNDRDVTQLQRHCAATKMVRHDFEAAAHASALRQLFTIRVLF